MLGKLVRHKANGKIGVVLNNPEYAFGFPYDFEGNNQAYFPATSEDILNGEVSIDVRKYEIPHVKVLWEDEKKPQWVRADNLEIIQ